MAFDRFIIAPFNSGLETDIRPWLLPEDAFTTLNNAYVFRGRVRKRFGTRLTGTGATDFATLQLLSRVRVPVGTTDGSGNFTAMNLATILGIATSSFKVGQMFSVDDTMFTVYQSSGDMYSTDSAATGSFNIATGVVTITGSSATTTVYWYPAQPIMGLDNYEGSTVNNSPALAFDTQFAYLYSGAWNRTNNTAVTFAPTWHGDNLDYFWSYNWDGLTVNQTVLFVSNYQASLASTALVTDDPIWTYSTSLASPFSAGNPWVPFSYSPSATINPTNTQPYTVTRTIQTTNPGDTITSYIQSARIIVAFKNRLLLLNTIENNANGATPTDPMNPTTTGVTATNYLTSTNTKFGARMRYSHSGSPFSLTAWLEPRFQRWNGAAAENADGAGFLDATTEEEIISAEFIKDRLIVYFERSTWEIVYTGNQIEPFVWQKINTELGSEATFSTVPFDKVVLTVGSTGVHACNGSNVERIDNKIPDTVFQIRNKDEGVHRVAGIRDYYTEMVYWTFPADNQNPVNEVFCNKVLVYNYKNGSWAFNDDVFTSWGYFEQQLDAIWSTSYYTWNSTSNTWTSGVTQSQFKQVIAGNQQGFILLVDATTERNAPSMQVTDLVTTSQSLLTILSHTLQVGDVIAIENGLQDDGLGNITPIATAFVRVREVVTNSSVVTDPVAFTGTYVGQATAARVSRIDIQSKQWNPYVDKSRNVFLHKIDFGVLKTANGSITVDYYPSSTQLSMLQSGQATGALMGSGILDTFPYSTYYPLEDQQERIWHPVYFQTDGECIQVRIYLSDDQLKDVDKSWSDFELEGMVLYTQPTTSRLQ